MFYNIFLFLFSLGIRLASLVDPKAKSWIRGRKKFPELSSQGPTIWMHCASLGEFEQGRPLLEALKSDYPQHRIVITFFSPSGYEVRKNYRGADAVIYLPMDSHRNAVRFLDMVKPDLVIWIRYEYWYHYLLEIKKRNIPLLLVSAVFRPDQPFFKWYGSLWRKILRSFTHIFVQNEESMKLLEARFGELPVSLTGDTRFDRVSDIAGQWTEVPGIRNFCLDKKVIVAGSTWEEDEEEWVHYVKAHPEIRFLFAPHLVDEGNIREVCGRFKGSIRYTDLVKQNNSDANVLIMDNIGMLSRLYQYADITYVGGGFGGSGLHNILEAAVYGKPVIIGPVHEKHYEAGEMIAAGGAFSVRNALELEQLMDAMLQDQEKKAKAGLAAGDYVKQKRGATPRIMNHVREKRLLTSASN